MSQNWLIHSAADECLDCFHMFWLHSVNSATVNMNVHVSIWVFVFWFVWVYTYEWNSGVLFVQDIPCPQPWPWGSPPGGNSIPHISGSRRGHMTCFGQWMQWERRWPGPLVIRSLRNHWEALPWLLSHIQWSCGMQQLLLQAEFTKAGGIEQAVGLLNSLWKTLTRTLGVWG